MDEIWAPVDGAPGYEVSTDGRVRGTRGFLLRGTDHAGYRRVTLCVGGEHRFEYVHRLVALAFIPNPLGLPEVNHIDPTRSNNFVGNLEWVTRQGNVEHASRMGLLNAPGVKGSEHHAAKLTEDQVREIYQRYASGEADQHQLALEYGVAQTQVWRIVSGDGWTHVTGGTPARAHRRARMDYPRIEQLHRSGHSPNAIAKSLGYTGNGVRKALRRLAAID